MYRYSVDMLERATPEEDKDFASFSRTACLSDNKYGIDARFLPGSFGCIVKGGEDVKSIVAMSVIALVYEPDMTMHNFRLRIKISSDGKFS